MKATPFNRDKDLAPLPFDQKICDAAKNLKDSGVEWTPHVGCFLWDEKGLISVPSPFPNRIYFILNLNHFLKICGSLENIKEKFVWLPTEYQAQLLAEKLEIKNDQFSRLSDKIEPIERLMELYNILISHLSKKK